LLTENGSRSCAATGIGSEYRLMTHTACRVVPTATPDGLGRAASEISAAARASAPASASQRSASASSPLHDHEINRDN
jgi:hypothetical protein